MVIMTYATKSRKLRQFGHAPVFQSDIYYSHPKFTLVSDVSLLSHTAHQRSLYSLHTVKPAFSDDLSTKTTCLQRPPVDKDNILLVSLENGFSLNHV